MSNQLAAIAGELSTTLVDVKAILPAHVSYERFVNCAAVAISNNADLAIADKQSVINALSLCAKDGLIPDNREAALVIFNKNIGTRQNPNWIKQAQYMPMIDGVLKRARQSGVIKMIASRALYKNDKFRVWIDDSGEHVFYEPCPLSESRGEIIGAFAYAVMNDGTLQFETMNIDDINRVKSSVKGSDNEGSVWNKYFDRMSCKSVTHRLVRRLPNSNELVEMLERGQQMEWQNDDAPIRDVTPKRDVKEINSVLAGEVVTNQEQQPEQQAAPTDQQSETFAEYSERIALCETMDQLRKEYELGYKWAAANFPSAIEHLTMAKDERKKQLESAVNGEVME